MKRKPPLKTQTVKTLSLTSHFTPGAGNGTLEIRLTNGTDTELGGFTLGLSGPGRIAVGARLTGADLVDQMGTWFELAPPKGYVLLPGAVWTVTAETLNFPFAHWTDGTTSAMV